MNDSSTGTTSSIMRNRNLEYIFFAFLFLIIILFVYRTLSGGVLFFDDGFYPFNPHYSILQNFSSWNNPFFPGGPYYGNFFYLPFILFVSALRFLGFSYYFIDAAYISLNLLIGSIGFYLLTKLITTKYILKTSDNRLNGVLLLGSAISSFYYIFNYQQESYYGGEFYPSFILINLTPIFLYFILQYLESPIIYGIWNRYLGFSALTAFVISGGLWQGPYVFWFALIVLFSIFLARISKGNMSYRKPFSLKFISLMIVIVASMAWVLQAVYYGGIEAIAYGKSVIYLGKPVLIATSGYPSVSQNLFVLFSSYYGALFYSFPSFGPNNIWYSSVKSILTTPLMAYFIYIPVILSFSYLLFLAKKGINRWLLIFGLAIIAVFLIMTSRLINMDNLLYSSNFVIVGFAYSFSAGYAVYPFVIMVGVNMAISLNLLQLYFIKRVDRDNQTIFRINTKSHIIKFLKLRSRFFKFSNKKYSRSIFQRAILKKRYVQHIQYYSTFVIIILLMLLFIFPVFNSPLEHWEYNSDAPVSGTFVADTPFEEVGQFLSKNSPYNNVLYLPITVSPSGYKDNGSSFMIVNPPFSSFFDGLSISSDAGPTNSSFAYPILKYFPNQSIPDIANYLRLLGIKYIILNTAEYPTWVTLSKNEFAGGGPPWDYAQYFQALNNSAGIEFVKSFGPFYIYEVSDSLPSIYLSSGVPANAYGTSPSQIFYSYSNDFLTAGSLSIINTTHVSAYGYNLGNGMLTVTSSLGTSVVKEYNITLSNDTSNVSGYYQQVITLTNYSYYGINTNASNFYIKDNNGSDLYSWIQFHNSSTLTFWTKVPYGTREIYLNILSKNVSILSSNGYLGNANFSTNNIRYVFPSYVTNYNYTGGTLFSQNYFGFGFVIKSVNPMNLTTTPFIQMENQYSTWNPWWEFYSGTNSTSSPVSTILGNTVTSIKNLSYGYAYVYNHNSTSQNTIEVTNGQIQSDSGDGGIISTSFYADGGRGINLTLADAFQFKVPVYGMPNYNVSAEGVSVHPIYVNLTGNSTLQTDHEGEYNIFLSENGKNLNSSQLKTLQNNGIVLIYDGSTLVNTVRNFYISDSALHFNVTFQHSGNYTLVYESNLGIENVRTTVMVDSYRSELFTQSISLSIYGSRYIMPNRTYTYTVYANYSNGSTLNYQDTLSVYRNLSFGAYSYNNLSLIIKKLSFSSGKMAFDITSEKNGAFTLFAASHFYSGVFRGEVIFERLSNTHYIASVHINSSSYLILNQGFNSGWIASSDGQLFTQHYIANGFANAWLLPKGNYTITISFTPQKAQNLLNITSITTTGILSTILIVDFGYFATTKWRKRREVPKYERKQ